MDLFSPMKVSVIDVVAPSSYPNSGKFLFENLFSYALQGDLAVCQVTGYNELSGIVFQTGLEEQPVFRKNGQGRDDAVSKLVFRYKDNVAIRAFWEFMGNTIACCHQTPSIRIAASMDNFRTVEHLWTGRFRINTNDIPLDGEFRYLSAQAIMFYNEPSAKDFLQQELDRRWKLYSTAKVETKRL